ncbi:MAG: hypothetical protein IT314_09905 [Anaerolineales bacterium]|nr:hypothetical protein [Anaerolineales bacterium]
MIYPTLRATVHKGKVELLDEVQLPENAQILVTVMDEIALDSLTLGDHLAAGLRDVLLGRVAEANSPEELESHLDAVLKDA